MSDPLWGIFSQSGIKPQRTTFTPEDTVGRTSQANVDRLEARVEKLTLICHAMWAILKDKTQLSEEDLLAKVMELDLADGVADGRHNTVPKDCPACKRPMSSQHKRCLYCGHVPTPQSAFETL
ncbi:MAG: hypothetical protein WCJ97_02645 [Phycisphaerae bacterium]